MICLELNYFFLRSESNIATYRICADSRDSRKRSCSRTGPGRLWNIAGTLCSSVWVDFNNSLLMDATDRIKISTDHHRIFFDVTLYPHSFFTNTPFNVKCKYVYIVKNSKKCRYLGNVCIIICIYMFNKSFIVNRRFNLMMKIW